MRFAKNRARVSQSFREGQLTVGFVPTIDCAPLAVAQELGLFRAQGLEVQLRREVGWASVREKLLHEEIDAAVAHASMLFSIYFGLGGVRRPCLTGLMMGHHGSAITLARSWWDLGARDARSLAALARSRDTGRKLTLGVVLEFSVQHFLLAEWLQRGGLTPDTDVRLAIVPSALMHESLRAGHIDGYCVAEPWNSAAALAGSGVVLESTGVLSPGHPDKALVVMQEFADTRGEEHERLLAALIEASRFCAAPENCAELAAILSRPAYLDVPVAVLLNGLAGPFETGAGARSFPELIRFDTDSAGRPDRQHGRWILDHLTRLGTEAQRAHLRSEAIRRIFREDIFHQAFSRVRRLTPPSDFETSRRGDVDVEVSSAPISRARNNPFNQSCRPASACGPALV